MSELEILQQRAIQSVMAHISETNETSTAIRENEFRSLQVAASMNIEQTVESLKEILRYKKEASKQMLKCSTEEQIQVIAQILINADNMIKKILGMYTPDVSR